jgi:hypothetical protein
MEILLHCNVLDCIFSGPKIIVLWKGAIFRNSLWNVKYEVFMAVRIMMFWVWYHADTYVDAKVSEKYYYLCFQG